MRRTGGSSFAVGTTGGRIARWTVSLLVGVAIAASGGHGGFAADDATVDLSGYYGFKPLELFKLERRSANLVAGDMNHDGRIDLVLVDNSHSRIDLLLQRASNAKSAPAAQPVSTTKPEVNAIPDSSRFEHKKISVDREVSSLALGDFNGDKRTDIAYFGAPDRLVVLTQPESGDWTGETVVRLADVDPRPWILGAGDVNGDGRDDLVVLGKSHTYVVRQTADGKLAPPQTLPNTSEKLGLLQIADLDGDGRTDLCYVVEDQSRAMCVRFQQSDGRLGPELQFELRRPRAVTLHDMDRKPGKEIVSIDSQTQRVKLHRVERPAAQPGELAGRLIQFGLGNQNSGRDRDLATGDLDGDGRTDVVVTDPEAAQMLVFRQQGPHGLDLGTTFPGLVGAQHVRCGDFDGDKRDEVVVLSAKEGTLGLSKLDGGRLTFPQSLPVTGEPVALDVADLDGDAVPEIVYVARTREGSASKYSLRALKRGKTVFEAFRFGKLDAVPLELRGAPERLTSLDADADGKPDFLVFLGLDRAPHLFATAADGTVSEVQADGGIRLGSVPAGAAFVGGAKRDGLLIAQDNFARRLKLKGDRQWQVVDQYNANETSARIVGAAALNLDGRPGDEIVLVDGGVDKLRVLRLEDNVYRPWREVETGKFPYKSIQTADLDGDGQLDLLLFGRGQFAVLYAGRTDPKLVELATFETKLEKASLSDVIAGDVNDDGYPDLTVLDTQSQNVEVLDFDPRTGLRHALAFPLFEEKSFSRSEGAGTDPREGVLADVTGDGLPDLVLLTHDRVLVLPQDRGK